ncbi:Uncharacterised protein [Serratia fonticola]|uniref:Uncharacterized protein n=1 Tax=Serratia fonticola TaxID=47917 RepID=A0A448S2H1_SERFO|nr:Uncharacterised protein [Serratia fonticola]
MRGNGLPCTVSANPPNYAGALGLNILGKHAEFYGRLKGAPCDRPDNDCVSACMCGMLIQFRSFFVYAQPQSWHRIIMSYENGTEPAQLWFYKAVCCEYYGVLSFLSFKILFIMYFFSAIPVSRYERVWVFLMNKLCVLLHGEPSDFRVVNAVVIGVPFFEYEFMFKSPQEMVFP